MRPENTDNVGWSVKGRIDFDFDLTILDVFAGLVDTITFPSEAQYKLELEKFA